jgi:putative lipoic acid-binding regulatory protein
MGVKMDGFKDVVIALCRQFDPQLDPSTVELRQSKAGNYQGVTVTINATSRAQLDEVYRTLSSHPLVKVVL